MIHGISDRTKLHLSHEEMNWSLWVPEITDVMATEETHGEAKILVKKKNLSQKGKSLVISRNDNG